MNFSSVLLITSVFFANVSHAEDKQTLLEQWQGLHRKDCSLFVFLPDNWYSSEEKTILKAFLQEKGYRIIPTYVDENCTDKNFKDQSMCLKIENSRWNSASYAISSATFGLLDYKSESGLCAFTLNIATTRGTSPVSLVSTIGVNTISHIVSAKSPQEYRCTEALIQAVNALPNCTVMK